MNLSYFSQKDFYKSLKQFFSDLNIPINPVTEAPDSADSILSDAYNANNPAHKLMDDVYFVGMVSEDAFAKQREIKYATAAKDIKTKDYDCMLLFGVTLKAGRTPSRSQLAEITRAFNRQFSYYPVVVIFKYGETIAFANCERLAYKQAWRAGEKAGKVSLLKDIAFNAPHTGHLKILQSLEIVRSGNKAITTFAALYKYWQDIFSVSILNKSFYQELSNWYFWALSEISFPDDAEKNDEIRTAENSIRLITRLIFVWFLKEKGLVPGELFDKIEVDKLLDYRKDKTESAYYRAILQNLFFATLNVPMDEREFRDEKRFQGKNDDYMNHRVYRYADLFKKANSFETLFAEIPFLNGGLFDCLDYRDENGKEVRIDCYSDNPKNAARLTVPDKLFFGSDVVDLSEIYDDRRKNAVEVRGIIDILNSYKFTIAENTPVEEEIALDPELLGRVFENLLASYNPETQTTARKQTGSFYTPREIVNYMVDESLKAYLATTLGDDEETKTMLDQVLDYGDDLPEMTDKQRQQIIAALEDAKILDPACGSGAFPMGILQKMVRVLEKLDPKNERWKQSLIKRTPIEARKEMEAILEGNTADYSRKLGIIQNCIYGVDIQPIAIQVSKLRFFISLLVDFSVDKSKSNFGIQPLPNLDYKLMQGNSLIEDFHGFTLNLKEQDTDDDSGHLFCENSKVVSLIEDLWEKQADYLRESRPKQKEKLREDVEKDIVNIFDTYIRQKKAPYFTELKSIEAKAKHIPSEKQKAKYIAVEKQIIDKRHNFNYVAIEEELKYLTHGTRPRNFFPWQLYFADVFNKKGGFDIVIGNPPYYQLSKDKTVSDEYKQHLRDKYNTSGGRLNTFIFFIHEGYELLKHGGYLAYIIPNTLLTQEYYRDTRELILNNTLLDKLITYDGLQFENAVVENITLFFTKGFKAEYEIGIYLQRGIQVDLIKSKTKSQFLSEKNYSFNINSGDLSDKIYNLKNSDKLCNHCDINQAIALKGDKSLSLRNSNPNGKFYKLLDGRNINKYSIAWDGVYLDYDVDRIHSCKKKDIFLSGEKLLFRRVSSSLIFTYDNSSFFALNTLVVVNKKPSCKLNIKYILAVMNSKLMNYLYKSKFKSTKTVFSEIQARSVGEMPIILIPTIEQDKFVTIVDKILALKKADVNIECGDLLLQIDKLVFSLYELTPDEIAVVEGA